MAIVGVDPNADESGKLREILELCAPGDRQRILDLFRAQLEKKVELPETDWSDKTGDGPRSAPTPALARAAKA